MLSSVICLAFAMYYEAGNQEIIGKLAVGQVVINRVKSKRYPNTICEVVTQDRQFSFYSDGKPERVPTEKNKIEHKAWEESYQLATFLLAEGSNGEHVEGLIEGAVHYHADYVKPLWAKGKSVTIGNHIFYSEVR